MGTHFGNANGGHPQTQRGFVLTAEVLDVVGVFLDLGMLSTEVASHSEDVTFRDDVSWKESSMCTVLMQMATYQNRISKGSLSFISV